MRVLDLFSGIGGFSYGLQLAGTVGGEAFETVAFCEIDPWCRRVLAKNFPGVPIFEDVTKLRGADVGPVDVICGGYPCQPFSLAGERKGQEDDRHLWPEFNRLVAELRPRWVIGENVAGHISMGLDSVLSDLEDQGYTCRAFVIPACAVDARHRRDRVWILANTSGGRCGGAQGGKAQLPGRAEVKRASEALANPESLRWGQGHQDAGRRCEGDGARQGRGFAKCSTPMADTDGFRWDRGTAEQGTYGRQVIEGDSDVANPRRTGCEKQHIATQPEKSGHGARGAFESWHEWPAEPGICRVANGISRRVDRIKGLGNAVVPQVVMMIGWAILAAEAEWRAAA